MMTLFDMFKNAHNGEAMKNIANQFGLDEMEMKKTIEALMPAFSTGLKRNIQTPDMMNSFMKALSTGDYTQYFEDISKVTSAEGISDGNHILAAIFGSKDVSRAIAAQAATLSGVGQDMIKKLLPVLASTLMGSIYNQAGQVNEAMRAMIKNTPPTQDVKTNPFTQMMGNMSGNGQETNPFGQMLEGMMGGYNSPLSNQNNPFFQVMENMFGDQNSKKPDETTAGSYDEILNKMLDAGHKVQDEYQKNINNIFDQFLDNTSNK